MKKKREKKNTVKLENIDKLISIDKKICIMILFFQKKRKVW